MNTLKFITKAYESDPYIKAFLDNAAKDAQEKGTPLISALGAETTRVLGLMSAPTSAPQVATPAPAKRKPGPKPGTPRKAKAKATAEGGKVRGLPVIAESEQTVSQG